MHNTEDGAWLQESRETLTTVPGESDSSCKYVDKLELLCDLSNQNSPCSFSFCKKTYMYSYTHIHLYDFVQCAINSEAWLESVYNNLALTCSCCRCLRCWLLLVDVVGAAVGKAAPPPPRLGLASRDEPSLPSPAARTC